MNENMTYVPSRLTSAKTNKVVAGANEILDDDINLKQDVINTLSKKVIDLNSVPTSSTLTYTVNSVTCNFKVGDEVRVADQESETGYTFYKLYALTTEGSVTTATWDKLGAGGGSVNPNETVNISLTQVGGNSADLISAAVTIIDDDSGDTLFTGTWNGNTITTEIDVNTNYTVSVETIAGYMPCTPQSYQAGYQTERNISFQYRALGVFIEATDGTLYTATQWDSAGKTANSIVLITNVCKRRWALVDFVAKESTTDATKERTYINVLPLIDNETTARTDYNGRSNTQKALTVESSTERAAGYCNAYTFPNGVTNGYWPAYGEVYQLLLNVNAFNACRAKLGLNDYNNYFMSSSFAGNADGVIAMFWSVDSIGRSDTRYGRWGYYVIPAAEYEE